MVAFISKMHSETSNKKDNKEKKKILGPNGVPLEHKSLIETVAWEVAKKFRLMAKSPIPGDLINEVNYDLKNIQEYKKKVSKFDKTRRKACK